MFIKLTKAAISSTPSSTFLSYTLQNDFQLLAVLFLNIVFYSVYF